MNRPCSASPASYATLPARLLGQQVGNRSGSLIIVQIWSTGAANVQFVTKWK